MRKRRRIDEDIYHAAVVINVLRKVAEERPDVEINVRDLQTHRWVRVTANTPRSELSTQEDP